MPSEALRGDSRTARRAEHIRGALWTLLVAQLARAVALSRLPLALVARAARIGAHAVPVRQPVQKRADVLVDRRAGARS